MIFNFKSKFVNFFKFIKNIKPHFFRSDLSNIKESDVIFFCHDDNRSLMLNNLHYSPLIDSIYDELIKNGIKCQSFSLPWSRLGYSETYNKSIIINRGYLIALIIKKFRVFKEVSIYGKIFDKSKAKYIIGIGMASDLCLAAKAGKITVVELLHGIGYAFIPWGWDQLDAKELPDKILVLDDVSKNTFKPLESKGVSVIKIPHPFYKKILDPRYIAPKEWSYVAPKATKNILITLQWGYAGEVSNFNGILNNGIFYDELELLIQKRRDIIWHFRLHPVQLKNDNAKNVIKFMKEFAIKHPNVIWEKSSKLPLANVAFACDLHITMNSMACYDVAIFGLPSLILCPTTRNDGCCKDYFSDLVLEGYAFKNAIDIDFIENWIGFHKKMKPRPLAFASEDVWNDFICEIKNSTNSFV